MNQPAEPGGTATPEHGFNLSSWTLRHQALVIFVLALITLFGVLSYRMGSEEERIRMRGVR